MALQLLAAYALLSAPSVVRLVEQEVYSQTSIITGPCDIYEAGGTPCVAAHSLVRALYGKYNGPLYLVRRSSDLRTFAINTLTPGGFANSAAQDAFCGGTNCSVTRIFDQSPRQNHLGLGPAGGMVRTADRGVNATKHKLKVGGQTVYGAFFEGGMGYRCDSTWGVATGDQPESMYMVVAGRHFNGGCCFDYGNAEIDALDHGEGTMEALYWGSARGWGRRPNTGPWVMADLENGLWAGDGNVSTTNHPIEADFVTAMVKGKAGVFAIKGGDANTAAGLESLYEGPRPPRYQTMQKQGAIILGIGGDNSDWAVGTWYEGAMTSGYASAEIDSAVHANIAAVGYGR